MMNWRHLAVAALLPCTLVAVLESGARAQAIRSQTNRVSNAVQNQIRQAIRPHLTVKNAAGRVLSLDTTPDGKLLCIALEDKSVRLWDLQSGIEQARLDTGAAPARFVRIGQDGRRIVGGGDGGIVTIFDAAVAGPGRRITTGQGAIVALDISRDAGMVATAGSDGTIALWDAQSGTRLARLEGGSAAVTSLALSTDGTLVASGAADGGIRIFLTRAPGAPTLLTAAGAVRALRIDNSGRLVTSSADGSVQVWVRGANAPLRSFRGGSPAVSAEISNDGRYVALSDPDSRVDILDVDSGNSLQRLSAPADSSRFLVLDIGRRRVMTGGADGAVRVWNLSDGANLAQIISTLNGWAVVDDKGRFDGSQQGIADIGWSANQTSLAIDGFSDDYFEPGLLAKRMSDRANFVAPAPTAVADGIYLPPKLSLVPSPGPYAEGQEVEIAVTAEDQGGGVAALRLFQNGKLVAPETLQSERSEARNGVSAVVRTYRVRLVAATNRFNAVAANQQRIDAEPVRLDLLASGKPGLPSLHILTIGINKYRDARYNLDYGVPDAQAVLHQMSGSTAGVFRRVISYQLVDAAATRGKILETLDAFRAMPATDVLAIYVASHGEVIGNEWYMLPYDTNFATLEDVARTSVGAAALRDALARIGAERILVLVDSCKSGGSIDTLAASMDRKVLRALGRDAGVAILAAARKDQLAAELTTLGHGAFTYVVLQALSGQAGVDPGGGRVTAGEILDYSTRTLPQLTKRIADYTQVPVAYRQGDDFVLRDAAR